MKNFQKGSTAVVLIIIIVLLIISFGAYVYYQNQSTKDTLQTNNIESTSSSTSVNENWQTYNGSNFSIKYPPSWTIMSNIDKNGKVGLIFVGVKETDSYTPSLKLSINKDGGSYNKAIISIANSNYLKNKNNGNVSTSSIMINGITGTKIEVITPAIGTNWENDDFYVLFEKGSNQYSIEGTFKKSDASGASTFTSFYNSLILN